MSKEYNIYIKLSSFLQKYYFNYAKLNNTICPFNDESEIIITRNSYIFSSEDSIEESHFSHNLRSDFMYSFPKSILDED
jgi:hypothetical protein